jgi:hypothetical protein
MAGQGDDDRAIDPRFFVTVRIFIPDNPEFMALVEAAEKVEGCKVLPPKNGYWIVEAEKVLRISRKVLNLGPAIWNSALSGGFIGRIIEYGHDEIVVESET